MNVRYVSETAQTVTYEWNPPQGQQVVRTTRPDGTQSVFWSPTKSRHTFKVKQEGSYLIDCLGLADAGAGEYPPVVDPPPPPPPPPTGFGAKLRAQFTPLPKSSVGNVASKPPIRSGTAGDPFTVKGWKANARLDTDGADYVRIEDYEGTKPLPPDQHALYVNDGSRSVQIDKAWIHDVQYPGTGHSIRPQGLTIDNGANVQVYGMRVERVGDDEYDHLLYSRVCDGLLMAGVLGWKIGAYGFHLFGGATKRAVFTNFTLSGFPKKSCAILNDSGIEDILFVNGIFHDAKEHAVKHSAGGVARVENCVMWKCGGGWTDDTSNVKIGSSCRNVDPMFVDAANGDFRLKPGSPCLTGADPGWVPPWDAYGNPYTRACLGAVAA